MQELEQYEAECHSCGIHWSILEDPDNVFVPEHKTCPVCRGLAQYSQRLRKEDAQGRDQSDQYALDPSAGRQISIRSLTPDEMATWKRRSAGG